MTHNQLPLSTDREKPMVIIIPSYNNIEWYERNLNSVFMQNYENYRVIYIDDCSEDGTADAVADYVRECDQEHRFQLQRNDERHGAMANIYGAVHTCSNDEIAVLLDGDDWFFNNHVLQLLNKIYSSGPVWFTYGSMLDYPTGWTGRNKPIPPEVFTLKAYRQYYHPGHLKTFFVWIFKKIRLQDFLYQGEFFKMAWDLAIMYPIIEIAEERHAYIEDIIYVYNIANNLNDHKIDGKLQLALDKVICSRKPYKRLEMAERE